MRDTHASRRAKISIAIIALAPLLLLARQSFAAPITTPSDLLPGEQYRLAFVTSTVRDATSLDIADYDTHVKDAAEAVTELLALGTTWQVIGSTASVDAIDHTATTGLGLPIYLLSDVRLVDDYLDLWDLSIDVPLDVDEQGVAVTAAEVWTGTRTDGVASVSPLGDPFVSVGLTSPIFPTDWIRSGDLSSPTDDKRLYGVSGVLTVAPEPPSATLLVLALAGFLVVRSAPTFPIQRGAYDPSGSGPRRSAPVFPSSR